MSKSISFVTGLILAMSAAAPLVHAACDTTATLRFTLNGGEATDTKTGLTWQRCSVGQTWAQDKCTGAVTAMTWDQAVRAGRNGWRLPNRDELTGLTEQPCGVPSADKQVFPDIDIMHPMYWSSTAPDSGLAWLVGFNNGSTFDGFRTSDNAVRLVRDK